MESKLFEKLKLSLEPVAIYYTDELPDDLSQMKEGKKICVGVCMVAAANGKSFYFDRETYEGCPGGAIGIGFTNAHDKRFPLECLLSTGDEALAQLGKTSPFPMGRGERFFESPEIAERWQDVIGKMDTVPQKYMIMKPFSQASKEDPPAVVFLFANPDQISALVCMSGYYRGSIVSVTSPFGAACQSIAFANAEGKKEYPQAVLGFFDISQRNSLPKDQLSYTMTYDFYAEMEKSVEKSCLYTDSWEKLEKRL
ncbi:MAG: DUF169 domain-containing protein [Peptococcaceae bacterium]|nr:DUF169 domain-containing protein [Peptococcaceae bacterium]